MDFFRREIVWSTFIYNLSLSTLMNWKLLREETEFARKNPCLDRVDLYLGIDRREEEEKREIREAAAPIYHSSSKLYTPKKSKTR